MSFKESSNPLHSEASFRLNTSTPSKTSSNSLLTQPVMAWAMISFLLLITIVGCVSGAGQLVQVAFPMGTTLIAIYLYFIHPVFYINFNWWVWCFSPFIRRLSDYYQGSFQDGNLILVAPYLVTLVCVVTLYNYFPKVNRTGDLPFLLAASGVCLGLFVGVINNPLGTVARTFLDWMPPILFGLHLSVSWRLYPEIRKTTQVTFIWIVLIAGIYGVYQYIYAPAWDTFWLIGVGNVSFGVPEPLGIRVWSTMNSPPPFGCIMMGALLLMFTSKGALRIPAAGVGYLAFLLSLVRAAWTGWIIGLITLVISLKSDLQMRLVATIVIMALCVVPLTIMEPFGSVIIDRVESFTNIQRDTSYTARAQTYDDNLETALSSFIGQGLGSTWIVRPSGQIERVALDSGFLDTFFTLGWLGGIPYLGSIILLLLNQFKGPEGRFDAFASAARAITLSFFTIIALGPFMLGLSGLMMWGFLGIGMAARKYYYVQKLRANSPELTLKKANQA